MKKTAIILTVLIITIFLATSCQKAKGPEEKKSEVQVQEAQKKEVKQSETKTEVQNKQEQSTVEINSPLTEQEQKEFDDYGGNWVTPEVFGNEKEVIRILKILIKGNHRTIRWYRNEFKQQLSDNEIKKVYGGDIATALSVINPKTNKEGFNLAVEILKTKQDYPEAMIEAAIALKVAQDKSVIPLLREVAKHPVPTVRLEAAGSLIMLGDVDTALPILDELADKEGLAGALYLLFTGPGKIIDERGYAIVEKALNNPKAEVKISAVKLLLESKKIRNEKAEEIALGIVEKFKSLKEYGLTRDPKDRYKKISIPGSGVDAEMADKQRGSDFRATEIAISILIDLKSKKAIPALEKIKQHPDASYLENRANDALEILRKGGRKRGQT